MSQVSQVAVEPRLAVEFDKAFAVLQSLIDLEQINQVLQETVCALAKQRPYRFDLLGNHIFQIGDRHGHGRMVQGDWNLRLHTSVVSSGGREHHADRSA